MPEPPSAETQARSRQLLLQVVKLRLQLLGRLERDGRDEMAVLEEIEKLQEELRDLSSTPIPPAPRPSAERRRHTRYAARVPLRYLVVNVPGVEQLTLEDLQQIPAPPEPSWIMAREVFTTNVSAGGLAFLIPGSLGRGSILWVEMKLPGAERVRAVASIARSLSDGTGTLVGAEFFGITEAEQETLRKELDRQFAPAKG